jgi:hypothetical protein
MFAELLHHREICVLRGVVGQSAVPGHAGMMPRLALAGKPRGMVAIGAGEH